KSRGSIQIMQQIAEKREGRCLSTEYINCNTKLDWECVKGHRWSTTPEIISQGSWCQVCYYYSRVVHTIEDMHRIAQEKGGYCLSTKYITSHTYLDWQCKEGHIWKAKPAYILNDPEKTIRDELFALGLLD
ncbi:3818_t:CDS:2, partial [Ambispora gerdemannii]